MNHLIDDGDLEGRIQRATEKTMRDIPLPASSSGEAPFESLSSTLAAQEGSLPAGHEPQQGHLSFTRGLRAHRKGCAQNIRDVAEMMRKMAVQELMMLKDLKRLIDKQQTKKERKGEILSELVSKAFDKNRGDEVKGHQLMIDIAEVYSPPRVAEMADRMELSGGWVWVSPRTTRMANHWILTMKTNATQH